MSYICFASLILASIVFSKIYVIPLLSIHRNYQLIWIQFNSVVELSFNSDSNSVIGIGIELELIISWFDRNWNWNLNFIHFSWLKWISNHWDSCTKQYLIHLKYTKSNFYSTVFHALIFLGEICLLPLQNSVISETIYYICNVKTMILLSMYTFII